MTQRTYILNITRGAARSPLGGHVISTYVQELTSGVDGTARPTGRGLVIDEVVHGGEPTAEMVRTIEASHIATALEKLDQHPPGDPLWGPSDEGEP